MQFEEGHLQQIVQQINDMLLAAGYFRSRIPGISQFDKVYIYSHYIYRFWVEFAGQLQDRITI